ncbi:Mov34/MPN/PAD-1 family protein [Thermodesulfobacteriota bacterium]
MLKLKRAHLTAMINHAKESYPNECCGIIAGRGECVVNVMKMANEIGSPVEYKMSDADVKRALDSLDEQGLDFLGVYHSHPTSDAYPSNIDVDRAVFDEVDQLIISLKDIDKPQVNNFRIVNKNVVEAPYSVID